MSENEAQKFKNRLSKHFQVFNENQRSCLRLNHFVREEELEHGGAAIEQWIHLCLPSCRPGFESQAYHLGFFKKRRVRANKPVKFQSLFLD